MSHDERRAEDFVVMMRRVMASRGVVVRGAVR
jgi:hypothetical protein